MILQRDDLPEATSIFIKNHAYIFLSARLIAIFSYVLFKYRHTLFGGDIVRETHYQHDVFQLWILGGFYLAAEIVGLATYWWKFKEMWQYTIWNKNKIPYIKLDTDSITLLGKSKIPWSSIEYVQSVKSISEPRSCYLILELTEVAKGNLASISYLYRVTRPNKDVCYLYRKKFDINLAEDEFVSVKLDGKVGLSVSIEKTIQLTKQYWSVAADSGE